MSGDKIWLLHEEGEGGETIWCDHVPDAVMDTTLYHHDRIVQSKDAEIAELKQALSGRTVSCSNCNDMGADINRLKDHETELVNEVERLREAVRVMRTGLYKIANCKQADVVKYIQTVDALALDALSAADDVLKGGE